MKRVLLLLTVITTFTFPQNFIQGDQKEIKEVILNSNAINSVILNYGSIGKPNYMSNIADLFWKDLGYMFEFGPLLAAEVQENSNTYHIVSDSYALTTQGDYSLDGTIKWGFLPRFGYANPNQNQIATSNNPNSWYEDWDSWPGEYGDGKIIADNEAYYVMDDFSNAEFPYYPFNDDSTKRGLGIKVETRVYQFGGMLKDALIVKYKITNESDKDLNKVFFGFFGDPHIGGASDYSDDLLYLITYNSNPNYSFTKNTIYCWDNDGKGEGNKTTGYLSFKLLETPDNLDLTSLNSLEYTNSLPNVPKNDELMWELFNSSIDTTELSSLPPRDNVIQFGTGPFSLMSGESKFLTLAIFLSDNTEKMIYNSNYISLAKNWLEIVKEQRGEGGNLNYKIKLLSPNKGEINGEVPITWQYDGSDQEAKIFLEYSPNLGKDWFPIIWEHPINENYIWNTNQINDGVNYLLRIICYNNNIDGGHYYDISDTNFVVNNPFNAKPEISFQTSFDSLILSNSPFKLDWLAEDADNTNLFLTLKYSYDNRKNFFPIFENMNYSIGSSSYNWDFSNLPNSNTYYLMLTASDGNTDSTIISTGFSIEQEIQTFSNDIFLHTSGKATPHFYLTLFDSSQIKSDTYELTFTIYDSTDKRMNIKKLYTGENLISEFPMSDFFSSPAFDGLKLKIIDNEIDINLDKSKFNREELNPFVSFNEPSIGIPNKVDEDWKIIFNNLDTLNNGEYVFPGDTVKNQLNNNVICPFRIINIAEGKKANYLINERNPLYRNNKWDFVEPIILRPQGDNGIITSYEVLFNFPNDILPSTGDTLFIFTNKPIQESDVFKFNIDTLLTNISKIILPNDFNLSQNYPNPFNPITTIKYSIPFESSVRLIIYNILGQVVDIPINSIQKNGNYEIIWNAHNYASGIYFYLLEVFPLNESKNFREVRKMILLK